MRSLSAAQRLVAMVLSIWLFIYFVPTLPEGNQRVDHTTKVPDESKGNQLVEHTTKVFNESYPLVDFNPLRLKHGPGKPFQALNLARIKNELIDKDRLKKTQEDPSYQKAVICGCYKCGTTSLWMLLFQQIFDRSFHNTTLEENGGKLFDPHKTESQAWQGAFEKPIPVQEAKEVLSSPSTFSFALIREPISRLVSAWKNKMACDGKTWGTSLDNREDRTKKLLKLSGMLLPKHIEENSKYCLEFPEFVEALRLVHRKGKQDYLNYHFLPQHLYCFRTLEPSYWMHIVTAGDPSIGSMFAHLFGLKDTNVTLAKENSSNKKEVLEISDHDMSILKAITADERAVIEPLLQQHKHR